MVTFSPDDKARWSVPFADNEAVGDGFLCGGLRRLPGGDLLAFRYSPIEDSGVDLIRLDPASGKAVWQAQCEALAVPPPLFSDDTVTQQIGERKQESVPLPTRPGGWWSGRRVSCSSETR